MTFNSTYLHLGTAVANGQLIERHPIKGETPLRRLFVTPNVANVLDGQAVPDGGFPEAEAIVVMDSFMKRWNMFVTLTYKKRARPDLERLDDLDEVWAMCFRKPRPGWRLLGRFVQKDSFVGLGLYDRRDLSTRAKYVSAATQAIVDWKAIFGGLAPLNGQGPDDYLSVPFLDLNES